MLVEQQIVGYAWWIDPSLQRSDCFLSFDEARHRRSACAVHEFDQHHHLILVFPYSFESTM